MMPQPWPKAELEARMVCWWRAGRDLWGHSLTRSEQHARVPDKDIAVSPRKVTIPYQNRMVSGTEVAVTESTERWSEVSLEDGTRIRLKGAIVSAVRIDNEYDPDGNPLYVVNVAPVMTIIEVPKEFKQKKN
jgi:hypothetical protein